VTNIVIGVSGLGAEVARRVAPRGRLLAADRSVEGVNQLAGDVVPIDCDVTDREQIEEVLAAASDLDAIIVRAGLPGAQADARAIFDVNLRGTAYVLATAEPRLRRNPIMTEMAARGPIGRRGRPDEVANVVSVITSGQASYMAGCDVVVDGGLHTLQPPTGIVGR
jgi:NAD(P)-dependent dehydrogenase (short-subunit alcohol dehydrogenase family)